MRRASKPASRCSGCATVTSAPAAGRGCMALPCGAAPLPTAGPGTSARTPSLRSNSGGSEGSLCMPPAPPLPCDGAVRCSAIRSSSLARAAAGLRPGTPYGGGARSGTGADGVARRTLLCTPLRGWLSASRLVAAPCLPATREVTPARESLACLPAQPSRCARTLRPGDAAPPARPRSTLHTQPPPSTARVTAGATGPPPRREVPAVPHAQPAPRGTRDSLPARSVPAREMGRARPRV